MIFKQTEIKQKLLSYDICKTQKDLRIFPNMQNFALKFVVSEVTSVEYKKENGCEQALTRFCYSSRLDLH